MEQINALPEHICRTLHIYLNTIGRPEPLPVQQIADFEGVSRQAIYKRLAMAEKILKAPIPQRQYRASQITI